MSVGDYARIKDDGASSKPDNGKSQGNKVKGEAARVESEDEKSKIALEYLKLARGEILEKAKIVNQTLGAYLAGSAALAGWFYQAVYKPPEHGAPSLDDLQKAYAAIGFALMTVFLAFAVVWIIYHNERIIAALAIYQRDELGPLLGDKPRMWESSFALRDLDGLAKALTMVFVEELIVLSPPLAALVVSWWQINISCKVVLGHCSLRLWLAVWLLANSPTAWICFRMIQTTRKLRRKPDASGIPAGMTQQPVPLHPSETQHN